MGITLYWILANDIRKCFPPWFNEQDKAFLDADTAIDPLTNNTPTTRDAVDLDHNDDT